MIATSKIYEDREVLRWSITYIDKDRCWGIIRPILDKRKVEV